MTKKRSGSRTKKKAVKKKSESEPVRRSRTYKRKTQPMFLEPVIPVPDDDED